jgi:hypothetical protein
MPTDSLTADFGATDQLVAHATKPSNMAEIMRSARAWFQHKPSVELAQIVGCDVRTAERYFAGDRTPATEQIVAMLRSEVGPRLIEAVINALPESEQRRFWNEMAAATIRALMVRGNNEAAK